MSEYQGVVGCIMDTVNRQYKTIQCDSDKLTQNRGYGIRYTLYYHLEIIDMTQSHSAVLEQLKESVDE